MAMHYRRHNNPPVGGANPFTGRSLPNGRSAGAGVGGRGGDHHHHHHHGNTPSLLVSSLTKKAVFLVLTFTIFFYVIFSPEYEDGSHGTNQPPSIKKEESNGNAVNKSFVDLSKKPQSEPVKLILPSKITPDPDENESDMKGEKEVDSAEYMDERTGEVEEEMAYVYKDPDEQSTDGFEREDETNDDAAGAEEQLSPAEKVYGAHVHVDEEEGDGKTLGFGSDEQEEAEEEEAEEEEFFLDNGRGGLRGSKSAGKNQFERQEKPDYNEEKEKRGDKVAESSGDGSETIDEDNTYDEDKTFYKNQSPLEMPNSVVEDESAKSKDEKNVVDASEQGDDTETAIKPCQDDPEFRYKDHDDQNCEYVSAREKCNKLHDGEKVGIVSCPVSCSMVDDCLARLNDVERSREGSQDENFAVNSAKIFEDDSEGFSSNEKAVFEEKYGSDSKSMEMEANEQDSSDRGVLKNQPPLEVPTVDDSDGVKLHQTEVEQTVEKKSKGLSMEEDVDKQPKSMADELNREENGGDVKDLLVVKTEDLNDNSKTVEIELNDSARKGNDFDAEEETTANDESNDESMKVSVDTSEIVGDADEDPEVNKAASSVEDNLKEYLITNSEDEPKKDEKNTEDHEDSPGKSKDDKATLVVQSEIIDENEESIVAKEKVEDTDEAPKHSEGSNDTEQGDGAGKASSAKKTSRLNESSKYDLDEDETDFGDNEAISSPKKVQKNESDTDEDKVEITDEAVKKREGSNNAPEQDDDADEESSAKASNASQEVEVDLDGNSESIFEEKETAADKSVKRGGDSSSDQGDNANVVSKVNDSDAGSKDVEQEVSIDLSDNQALLNHGNETTGQIDESEEASESVEEVSGSETDEEHLDEEHLDEEHLDEEHLDEEHLDEEHLDEKHLDEEHLDEEHVDEEHVDEEHVDADEDTKGKKGTSLGDGVGDSIKESDAVNVTENIKADIGDSEDAKASKFDKSEEKAGESTKKNEDKKPSDADSPREFKQTENLEDDIKYAKVVNKRKEPAAKAKKENVGEGKPKEGGTEESPVDKDGKMLPIQGDLGEAIKESDAPLHDEETSVEKDVVRSSNTKVTFTQEVPDDKHGKADKSVAQKENIGESDEKGADNEKLIVAEDTTAKIDREREE